MNKNELILQLEKVELELKNLKTIIGMNTNYNTTEKLEENKITIEQLSKIDLDNWKIKNKLYNFIPVDELKSSKNKCYIMLWYIQEDFIHMVYKVDVGIKSLDIPINLFLSIINR